MYDEAEFTRRFYRSYVVKRRLILLVMGIVESSRAGNGEFGFVRGIGKEGV